ncbi:MAG: fatty acid oxidation complex subunit alpha FadJ [Acidimicrobiia bacterium]|nr:fatty acid oxidation complex subunit alpha FadJ [Acidimicrobiia bacterium]
MTLTLPQLTHFKMTVDDGVVVVLIDRADEKINTLHPEIFGDFGVIMDVVESSDEIVAVVLGSAKEEFLFGADIGWFSELDTHDKATAAIAMGHEMFARIENLHSSRRKPVVAAIRGTCLGGGTELALACSSRIVTDEKRTKLGQPEVNIGILPAGGGTQRLPALVGIQAALDMILTGKSVRPIPAEKMGLVDEVVPATELLDIATTRARDAAEGTSDVAGSRNWFSPDAYQKLALEKNPLGRRLLFSQAKQRLLAKTHGNYPAQERTLEAVQIGIEEGAEAGYAAEREFFAELVLSQESAALRSIFFTERALGNQDFGDPNPVDRVAVLGGGLMGGGIAAVSAGRAGAQVRIKEIDAAGVRRGLAHVSKYLGEQVKRHRMTEFEAERTMNQVTGSSDWRGFGNTDLVIEAVFEDLDVKRSILAEVEEITDEDTVFASNTSSLPISSIAEGSSRPQNIVGMHYFSPAEKMPLLEVITTDTTSEETLATAVDFGRRQGKTVIVVNDGTGFYTSRILVPYTNEALFLLGEGAAIDEIDQAIVNWGFPVGPLLLLDEVGIDVGTKIGKIMEEAFGDRLEPPAMMEGMISDDRKGRKNGRGFYEYEDGKRGDHDATVYEVIGTEPEEGKVPSDEIGERVALQMVNEAALCLSDGVLNSARDGDIGAVFGLGFPAFRGGPFLYVDQTGAAEVVERLRHYEEIHGHRFTPAQILVDAAEQNTNFRDRY